MDHHGHVGSNRTYLQSNPPKCTVLGPDNEYTLRQTYPCSILYVVTRYSRVVSVLDSRRRRARVQIAAATLSGNSLRQTVHTHRASVHQAAELVAALFRAVGVIAGLAEK